MPTILTMGETVISPTICLAIESEREPQTVVHEIIGRPDPDVTLRPASTRQGTIRLCFLGDTSETDSAAAEAALGGLGVWTIISDERSTLAFDFIVSGKLTRVLDDVTRNDWTVEVGFREVVVS